MSRFLTLALLLSSLGPAAAGADAIHNALDRMYRFDFDGAHKLLDAEIAAHPAEPLPYAFRAAGYLFFELDRLHILESEFFSDDKRLTGKDRPTPDPEVRQRFQAAASEARRRAGLRLASNPDDRQALFAQLVTAGVETDYAALVERRRWGILGSARESQGYAVRLLQLDPDFADAHLTTGLSEYFLGSLPFFVRWFVKIDGASGSKDVAVRNLELVAARGRYLAPFARLILATVHLREKRPRECYQILEGLAEDYPENPLFRRELTKLRRRLGEGVGG